MIIVKALLISSALVYIWLFCSIRLVNYEFKSLISFLRELRQRWLWYTGLSLFIIFSPIIFVVTVITKVLWKITDFILR